MSNNNYPAGVTSADIEPNGVELDLPDCCPVCDADTDAMHDPTTSRTEGVASHIDVNTDDGLVVTCRFQPEPEELLLVVEAAARAVQDATGLVPNNNPASPYCETRVRRVVQLARTHLHSVLALCASRQCDTILEQR